MAMSAPLLELSDQWKRCPQTATPQLARGKRGKPWTRGSHAAGAGSRAIAEKHKVPPEPSVRSV